MINSEQFKNDPQLKELLGESVIKEFVRSNDDKDLAVLSDYQKNPTLQENYKNYKNYKANSDKKHFAELRWEQSQTNYEAYRARAIRLITTKSSAVNRTNLALDLSYVTSRSDVIGVFQVFEEVPTLDFIANIASLNVSHTSIGGEDLKPLKTFLAAESCRLAHVDLSGNSIDKDAARLLAEGISKNKSLKTLKLDESIMDNESFELIKNAVKDHPTLESVTFGGNRSVAGMSYSKGTGDLIEKRAQVEHSLGAQLSTVTQQVSSASPNSSQPNRQGVIRFSPSNSSSASSSSSAAGPQKKQKTENAQKPIKNSGKKKKHLGKGKLKKFGKK